MKKMKMMILITCIFSASLTAPPPRMITIPAGEVIRPYEAIWNAVCAVESNHNPYAVGDKHLKEHSYGIVQIRKSRLDDYYQRTGIRYSVQDMFDVAKSKEVFVHYATTDNEYTARCWNGGASGMSKKSTLRYWKLIQKHL